MFINSINIKRMNSLLKKLNLLYKELFKLEECNKISSKELDNLFIKLNTPPKNAILKMSHVMKLFKLRRENKWNKDDFIYVIEPQMYNKVTKLTPKNSMFQTDLLIKNSKYNVIGYFHSGKSGFAHSGDGGDYGDLWWIGNIYMERWLEKIIKKGITIIKKLKK
jgi:hypothetical protein